MCDCSEERDRRARERARKAEALHRRTMGEYGSDDDEPPRFSLVQIALGSLGFLMALTALILKTVDQNTLYAILSKIGLGHHKKDGCLDPKKQKWPKPTPPPPPPPPPSCPPPPTPPKPC